MKTQTRPKWAKSLTAKEWKRLQECQGKRRPTLRLLKSDIEYQAAHNFICWSCKDAWNAITRAKGGNQ